MLVNKGHWFLFTVDAVLQCPARSTKTAIAVRLTMPLSPHKFLKVFMLSSDYRPSVDRPSTECWPITDRYIGEVSTNYRQSVGEKSAKWRWSIGERKAISAETHRQSVVRLSSESRPTIDWLRPSVDRLSTTISTDRSVDTTYSKHDSISLCLPYSWFSEALYSQYLPWWMKIIVSVHVSPNYVYFIDC